jgi:hypothetical protein
VNATAPVTGVSSPAAVDVDRFLARDARESGEA